MLSSCTCRHCGHRFEAEPEAQHRVLCGDVTVAADLERLASAEQIALLATDPPYNVGLEYGAETDDQKSREEYRDFTRSWFGAVQDVTQRQVVTPGCNNLSLWLGLFPPYHVAPWIKTNAMTNGKVSRFWCWEPVLFYGEKWPRTRANDIFDFPAGTHKDTGGHPCPKPVRLWAELLSQYSEEGDWVLDVFLGSGTALVAAQQTARGCLGLEISPCYVDVALARWMNLTGQEPALAATGQRFAEVKDERS